MDTGFFYAIMRAAYAAWESNEPRTVDDDQLIGVIPDTVLAARDAYLAEQGLALEKSSQPQFFIEHEGRRAEIVWAVRPPVTPPAESTA